MPRRYASYSSEDGFTWMNQLSTIGATRDARRAPKVTVDEPWGYGPSLEWAMSCPPPRHNFTSIPRIRSDRPAFDLNHPETVRNVEQT